MCVYVCVYIYRYALYLRISEEVLFNLSVSSGEMGSGRIIPGSGSNICKGENSAFKKLNKRASVVRVKGLKMRLERQVGNLINNAQEPLKILCKEVTYRFLAFCHVFWLVDHLGLTVRKSNSFISSRPPCQTVPVSCLLNISDDELQHIWSFISPILPEVQLNSSSSESSVSQTALFLYCFREILKQWETTFDGVDLNQGLANCSLWTRCDPRLLLVQPSAKNNFYFFFFF